MSNRKMNMKRKQVKNKISIIPEIFSGSSTHAVSQQPRQALKMLKRVQQLTNCMTARGFTLIEVLVVVLIIGVLAAVAVPQYQRAVLKSRFTALMPIAKSMADSNEVYYLEHGFYADTPQELTVTGQENYPDGTVVNLADDDNYSYVFVGQGTNSPNNYIVYQKHSEQFPGEIHCEADSNNTQAQEVCKSFGATEDIGETLTPGYLTYVLSGTGNGNAPGGGAAEPSQGGSGEEPAAPASSRPLSEEPSCTTYASGSKTCNYTYETGETMEELDAVKGKISLRCGSYGYGSCAIADTPSASDGYYRLTLRNGTDQDALYYDREGNLIAAYIKRLNYAKSIIYDSEGNIYGISVSTSENPYAIPNTDFIQYDGQGNVRAVTISGYTYDYDANGQSNHSQAPSVTGYNLTAAQMAELTGDTASTVASYTTSKCVAFPESYGCQPAATN